MINSRSLDDLLPKVQTLAHAFIQSCQKAGIEVMIYCTYRDNESQAALYATGRTKPGKVVTNAKAGESYHNYRCAFDFVPMVHGKPAWNDNALYTQCGQIAEHVGLEWAGRWKSFKETAHCQYTGGLSIADLKAGKEIK
jgi:peptidoglycan L-alanyl-D-glutamate endopeptidase CwlK